MKELYPIPMHPAYRFGDATPWGGDGLRTVYGRDIPDERTGEGMELSAIPGLESRDDAGETLTALVEKYGERILGHAPDGEPFPLLLKLLCARDKLSVQVHPDDRYAAEHEHKLGKTEAWVILRADEGASILYGLAQGVTREMLSDALLGGRDVEPLIHRVPVKPGDVYYMPSGMVHAIGGGILLYEIQQSSDVTYRLWDYNRTNAKGEKRPLHIAQSLDVIDPALAGQISHMPEDGHGLARLLDVQAFTLDALLTDGEEQLAPAPDCFRIFTALDALELSSGDWHHACIPGETLLVPATCPTLTVKGSGCALIAASGTGKAL